MIRATVETAAMTPMSDAVPPTCKIANTSAICTTASPIEEVVAPIHISRYGRLASGRSAPANRERDGGSAVVGSATYPPL